MESNKPPEMNNEIYLTRQLWLLYPAWGTILIVALGCIARRLGLHAIESGIFYLGFLGLLPSVIIVLADSKNPLLIRFALLFAYGVINFFVIFMLGWAATCTFCPSCS